MSFPVVIVLLFGTFCFSVGPKYAQGQPLPPLPKNATNKTVILKESIMSSAKYCSALHETNTARLVTLMLSDIDDPQAKCFLHCMLQRYKVMDNNGKYNQQQFQNFLDYIPDSAFLSSIRQNVPSCSKERGSSPCESAYKFMRCFYVKARAQVKIQDVDQSNVDALRKG